MEEGRNVAAALVSLEPMSREDASLFTDEPLEKLVRPKEAAISQALALDYLPNDRPLLTDGHKSKPVTSTAPRPSPLSSLELPPQTKVVGYGVSGGASPSVSTVKEKGVEEDSIAGSAMRPTTEGDLLSGQVERGRRKHGSWDGGDKK